MIERIKGSAPTRSRAVVHNGLVYTVAVSSDKKPDVYLQTRLALEAITRTLSEAGSDKSHILTATMYLADMSKKDDMNRAWDEWVDRNNAPQRACIGAILEGADLIEIVITAAQK